MFKILISFFCIGIFFVGSNKARAAFIENSSYYYSDSFTVSGTTATETNMFVDICAGVNIDSRGIYQVGWNYGMYSVSGSSGGVTTTYVSTQMGPKLIMYFNKSRTWSVGFAYNLVTTATYSSGGGTSELWKGSSMKVETGYTWNITDSFSLGLRLNFVTAAYVDKFIGTTYSVLSNARVHLYPAGYASINF